MVQRAFGLVETVVAMGLFIVFVSAAGPLLSQSYRANRLGGETSAATAFAQEGLDAARSIKNQGWTTFAAATGVHGVTSGGGTWAFAGTSDANGKYTRTVTVSSVNRDVSGNIVATGGTDDPDTKKVDSTVTWSFGTGRNESLTQTTYLTNFHKSIGATCLWTAPTVLATLNIGGGAVAANGVTLSADGNTAYLTKFNSAPDFFVINTTNPAAPSVYAGSLSLSGNVTGISPNVNYPYVYAGNSTNAQDLARINITTPTAPTVNYYDVTGNVDPTKPYSVGALVYVPKTAGADQEFIIYNTGTSTQTCPVQFASTPNEVFVSGGYAFLALNNTTTPLGVVNLTTCAAATITVTGSAGTGVSITGYTNRILLGQSDGTVRLIDVTTPTTSPAVVLSSISTGGSVNGMALNSGNTMAFLATSNATAEFRVLSITADVLTSCGSANMTSTANEVAYGETDDRAYVATANTAGEFVVMQP